MDSVVISNWFNICFQTSLISFFLCSDFSLLCYLNYSACVSKIWQYFHDATLNASTCFQLQAPFKVDTRTLFQFHASSSASVRDTLSVGGMIEFILPLHLLLSPYFAAIILPTIHRATLLSNSSSLQTNKCKHFDESGSKQEENLLTEAWGDILVCLNSRTDPVFVLWWSHVWHQEHNKNMFV